MPMPEFMVGYAIGFGSAVIVLIVTGLLFVRENNRNGKVSENKDNEKSQ